MSLLFDLSSQCKVTPRGLLSQMCDRTGWSLLLLLPSKLRVHCVAIYVFPPLLAGSTCGKGQKWIQQCGVHRVRLSEGTVSLRPSPQPASEGHCRRAKCNNLCLNLSETWMAFVCMGKRGWGMENGEWRMGGVGNRGWEMGGGGWGDGEWGMEDEGMGRQEEI